MRQEEHESHKSGSKIESVQLTRIIPISILLEEICPSYLQVEDPEPISNYLGCF